MKRPRIGITGPDRGGGVAWFFTSLNVRLSGGKPVRITPSRPSEASGIDGLILGGGADVDPRAYSSDTFIQRYLEETIHAPHLNFFKRVGRFIGWIYYPLLFLLRILFSRESHKISEERDRLEFSLLNHVIQQGKPVMGICRGSQIINVYFKGTLYENINIFYYEEPNPYSIFPVKTIYLTPGSKLRKIFGLDALRVNALHHQAVKEEGNDLRVAAREKNRIVQGIEYTGDQYIIGVQWHPEYLLFQRRQRGLFRALIESASMNRNH